MLDADLRAACLKALDGSREAARQVAEGFSWAAATRQFMDNIGLSRDRPGDTEIAKQP
ncbi:hypothetical protein D3C87_2091100 [compost metagenome]